MIKQTTFCLPTAGKAVPAGDDWIHEVKYDGYRMRVARSGKTVRARMPRDAISRARLTRNIMRREFDR